MKKRVLVTGGAGFIGSFLVDELVKKGHAVRVYDNLEHQVHAGKIPPYLNNEAEYIWRDVTRKNQFGEALQDIDVVYHFAAAVGVGQSMYQISHYTNTNIMGTAHLLDLLVNQENDVKKLIIAASMSSYGEGAYKCPDCGAVYPPLREEVQMKKSIWELMCPSCGKQLTPIPTTEEKHQDCNSVYGLTKKAQEDMAQIVGRAYGIPTVSMRFFNVYGPRQSLSNPYTGVAAIFMSRIKNNNPPLIYEDGLQTRDFISVHDLVAGNLLAMEHQSADYETFNVGTGNPISIKAVAQTLAKLYGSSVKPQIANKYRKGDVRHCFADITKIQDKLGFDPKIGFEEGMKELITWGKQAEAKDKFDEATKELESKGLL
jgi:dTDP-L-rhamnose 4-epimerase